MKKLVIFALVLAFGANAAEFKGQMSAYINELKSQAKLENPNFTDFDIKRGEAIFTSKNMGAKGEVISCQSCHGSDLTKRGKNYFTAKEINVLAPSANSASLSDVKEVQKWLKRNFKDVYNREGSATQKGDVLYYINSK